MQSIIDKPANGGIVVVPLNFFCSIRENDIQLRTKFINLYDIKNVNVFETPVFEDTTYTVCSFMFIKHKERTRINFKFYPSDKSVDIMPDYKNFIIGKEMYDTRVAKNIKICKINSIKDRNNNIIVKCIDDKTLINMYLDKNIIVDNTVKKSNRSYISMNITIDNISLNDNQQIYLCEKFNSYMTEQRTKYNSLFLTNYRDFCRKRISFNLVYKIISKLLLDYII